MNQDFNKDLEAAIYDIAGGTGSWVNLLTMMRQKSKDTSFGLLISGQDGRTQVMHQAVAGYDPAYISSYVNYYQNINVWSKLHNQFSRASTVYSTRIRQALPVQEELLKSEFYHDWVKPQDDIREGVCMMLGHNGSDTISLTANVPHRAADTLVPFWTETFESLVKPISLVANIQMLRNEVEHQQKSVEVIVSSMAEGTFLLSGQGQVLFQNALAQTLLSDKNGMRLLSSGDIQFTEISARSTTQTNVMLSTVLNRGWRMFNVLRGTLRKPFVVTIIQLAGHSPMMGPKRPRYMMVVKDPDAEITLPHSSVVEELLGLTAAEAKVALQLAKGNRTSEAAAQLQLSPNTVRNHISAILEKTGFARSSEVASFVRSLAVQLRQVP
jgi:DNA-binding CsgD family transcriptional regulator